MLDTIAKAIVFAWVYNSTGGSLWRSPCSTRRSTRRCSFLPVLPAVTGDTTVLVTGIVLHIAIAIAVVVIAGPARLTRSRHPLPVSP